MTNVRLAIEQDLKLKTSSHRFQQTYTLANKSENGVNARAGSGEQRFLEVDLKTIRYTAPATRKKKGVQKALSIEDRYMMENI